MKVQPCVGGVISSGDLYCCWLLFC